MKCLVCLSLVLNVALFALTGCAGTGTSGGSTPQQTVNPTPSVTTLAPASLSAGSASQALTLTGSGFVAASMAYFNGTALQTTYVNATSLQATIPAGLLMNGQTATINVTSPAPGGGSSNTVSFAVNAPTPPSEALSSMSTHRRILGRLRLLKTSPHTSVYKSTTSLGT